MHRMTRRSKFLTIVLQENPRLAQRFYRHISLDGSAAPAHSNTIVTTHKNNIDGDTLSERIDVFITEMILFTELQVKRSIKQKKILHGFEIVNAVIKIIRLFRNLLFCSSN